MVIFAQSKGRHQAKFLYNIQNVELRANDFSQQSFFFNFCGKIFRLDVLYQSFSNDFNRSLPYFG